jgi:uncharacterized membrane protein
MSVISSLSRLHIVRHVRVRPRLWLSFALGALVAVLLPDAWVGHALTRGLIGWNVGALVYLVLAFVMMLRATREKMHWRAKLEDEGRYTILVVASIATVAVLVAIAAQLALAREAHGATKAAHVALCGLTVMTAWLFTQTMFALHYAHEQLSQGPDESPAFEFPGTDVPDYFDFMYVACIIGTSAQTADVSFSARRSRRVGLMHCVLAFFFNTTLLALTINVAAGLI